MPPDSPHVLIKTIKTPSKIKAVFTLVKTWRSVFRPSLWPTLAMLFFIPLCLHLSAWQFGKAKQKMAEQNILDQQLMWPALDILHPSLAPKALGSSTTGDTIIYRPVVASGHFLSERGFLLDNQTHLGQAGFQVMMPLRLSNDQVVLVNRGFLAFAGDRMRLPALKAPRGQVQIQGVLYKDHHRPLAAEFAPKIGDSLWQTIDWNILQQQLAFPLIAFNSPTPLILREQSLQILDDNTPKSFDTYIRTWEKPALNVDKHLNYGWQWRLIAAAAFITWVFSSWHKKQG